MEHCLRNVARLPSVVSLLRPDHWYTYCRRTIHFHCSSEGFRQHRSDDYKGLDDHRNRCCRPGSVRWPQRHRLRSVHRLVPRREDQQPVVALHPTGNAFFFQGVGAWVYPGSGNFGGPSTVLSAKYGGDANAAALAIQNEFMSYGFNAVGEKSYGLVEPTGPCTGCKQLPEIQTFETNAAALFNR